MYNFTITEFPSGDGYWLLTGIGPLYHNERDCRMSLDFVEIDFEQYKENPTVFTYLIKEDRILSKKGEEPKKINQTRRAYVSSVGVDFLLYAEIGSVWQHRKLVRSISDAESKAPRFSITIKQAEQSKLTTIDQVIEAPFKYHPFAKSKGHHLASCLVITENNFTIKDRAFVEKSRRKIKKIIIMPSEIIRFYYAGCGFLIKQLFANGIVLDKVFVNKLTWYDQEKGEAFVQLRKDLQDTDANYVGRIALSRVSYQSAVDIGRRAQEAYVNKESPFITATFPIEGKTTLVVVGKEVDLKENTDEGAILVYAIQKCTAPFPYKKLLFDRDNNSDQTDEALTEKEASPYPKKKSSEVNDDSSVGSTAPVDTELSKVIIARTTEEKFTCNPEAERVEKEQQKVRTTGHRPVWLNQVTDYSTSDNQANGSEVAPTALKTEEVNEPVDYSALSAIVEQLRKESIDCTYLQQPTDWQEVNYVSDFKFPNYYPRNKSFNRWCSIKFDDKGVQRRRTRRVTVIRMARGGIGYYLIDCEARPTEHFSRVIVYMPGRLRISNALLDASLRLLATNKGIWSQCNLASFSLVKQAFYHLKNDTPEAVASRLLRYMDSPKK